MALPIGGQHVVDDAAKALDASDDTLCRQITIRLNEGDAKVYFGDSDVTAVPANAHGFLLEKESYTFGPFEAGGIRPKDIFLIGTADDLIFWSGIPL